jgi:hypothetical protein
MGRECTGAGVGQLVCASRSQPKQSTAACAKYGFKGTLYSGLIFHDLRRTAARSLQRAGFAETVIMKIGGWRTRSVFERCAIVSRNDIADAMRKHQTSEAQLRIGHEISPAEQKAKTSPHRNVSISLLN